MSGQYAILFIHTPYCSQGQEHAPEKEHAYQNISSLKDDWIAILQGDDKKL
jgi:hypothetical protein